MLKKGDKYFSPIMLGFFILCVFHICLASYIFQTEPDFTVNPPLHRHVHKFQLPKPPPRLTSTYPNPFFTTLTNEEEEPDLPRKQQSPKLTGIITNDKDHFALIEYDGLQQLYSTGDKLGAYQLYNIQSERVILRNDQEEICLALEERP